MLGIPDRREQRSFITAGSYKNLLRLGVVATSTVVAVLLVISAWNAADMVPARNFLVGWSASAAVLLAGILFTDPASRPGRWARLSAPFLTAQHVAAGFVVGLTFGTTDWSGLRLAGWWQLWWTVPLLLAYTSVVARSQGSSTTRTRPAAGSI